LVTTTCSPRGIPANEAYLIAVTTAIEIQPHIGSWAGSSDYIF
jgi:hypothetical protein